MPSSNTQFAATVQSYQPVYVRGLARRDSQVCPFEIITGSAKYPDLTFNQAGNVVLIPDGDVPKGMRCYVTDLAYTVNPGPVGGTAWTTGIGIELVDSVGAVCAAVPLVNMSSGDGGVFPFSESYVGSPVLTVNSGSTALVVNFAAASFIAKATCSLVGSYVTCTGTSAGTSANLNQTRRVTDHGTASVTFGVAWPVIPADNDTFTFWSHQSKATTGATTLTAADVTALTTSTMVGQFTTTLTGTGPDQTRIVTANTASALTVGTMAVAPDTSTTFAILNSAIPQGNNDFGNIIGVLPWSTPNCGIQMAVVGTMGAGSPVRVRCRGFFAV